MPAPKKKPSPKRTAPRGKDEVLLKRFASRVAKLRESKGLSYYALAKLAGVTDQALANLEQGAADVSLSRAVWIARALGVRLNELVQPD